MAKTRVSPTLLTDGISLVKGEGFNSWRTVGSVVAAARVFSMRDVDELMLLDVSATNNNRLISAELITEVASCLNVPLVVGGGVKNLEDFEKVLRAGADKVVVGSYAFENPDFISKAAERFGSQAVVASVDFTQDAAGNYLLATNSGKQLVSANPLDFAKEAFEKGAGEILLQSIQRDGLMCGMDLDLIKSVSTKVNIPVIASGGASNYEDLLKSVIAGAAAVSAGAMFQFTEQTPKGARDFLASNGVSVRVAN